MPHFLSGLISGLTIGLVPQLLPPLPPTLMAGLAAFGVGTCYLLFFAPLLSR